MSEPQSDRGAMLALALRAGASLVGLKAALVVVAVVLALLVFIGLFITAAGSAVGQSGAGCAAVPSAAGEVPANYVPWLIKAAQRYHLGPRGFSIVAAVHYVESDFGRSPLPGVAPGSKNYMGAMGPGQFLEESWPPFGVDADGNGVKNPYGIPDSIFATANLLHASGAPQNWHDALFAYNHAEWYVDEVLAKADELGDLALPTCEASIEIGGEGLERVESVARWIESRRLHYCWGGGHATKGGPSGGDYCWSAGGEKVFGASEEGLDCSGAVRWLLVLSGFEDTGPIVSGDFAGAYPSGPGKQVTIWSNAAHVFVTIAGRDWGTSETNFAHGPGYAEHTHVGFVASHPPGL
ncbi:MAG TPA: lytic transglycosylase domain-containing protein [Solirubrobacterales bacterium]|nr:lytic transglycosylase domain-containing protein [Solirubrobacterales bacterium]